ncbi:MAG: HlyD family type I secretion periplasmic adaptor subunit [Alphaproteobacteria bacterium]|nr:HlyD family type I secretion periplasmic adaptor subunit [Alphaproteobacteria bacterium]
MSLAAASLDAMVARHPLPTWRGFAWLAMLFLTSAGAWAYFAHLDEVAIARGEVAPAGKIKVIQHLEGGIVRAIHVAEGQAVRENDILVQLDLPNTAGNRQELQVRLDGLIINRARLAAEANETAAVFPEAEAGRQPEMVKNELAAHKARLDELAVLTAGLNEQLRQRELAVKELEASRRAKATDLRLTRDKFAISKQLVEKDLTSKLDHLTLEREVERLIGDIAQLDQAVPRSAAAVGEVREAIRKERQRFRREALEEIARVEVNIQRTHELFAEATDQFRRADIRGPIDGVVKNFKYNTIGGVVRPGDPIMEIVPSDGGLVIEAKLNPVDRGFVGVGQKAMVKISTYEYTRYGGLGGRVVTVAPDANIEPSSGQPYFKVVVETERDYLGADPDAFRISSGMQAEVDIHTGTKSVMDYLLKPVLKLRHEAFRER